MISETLPQKESLSCFHSAARSKLLMTTFQTLKDTGVSKIGSHENCLFPLIHVAIDYC